MKIACWNAEWNSARTSKGRTLRDQLLASGSEIICVPEGHDDFLQDGWHGASSDPDAGYPIVPGRRKVTVWSRQPWRQVDTVGSASLPPGRFVHGRTTTSLGDVDVIAICIPWHMAHVTSGSRDRQAWQDHRAYLAALAEPLANAVDKPCIVIGDFNQRIPYVRGPADVYEELQTALTGFRIWTAGPVAGLTARPVCHIGGSEHFAPGTVFGYSRMIDGIPVSDHDGVAVEVSRSLDPKSSSGRTLDADRKSKTDLI